MGSLEETITVSGPSPLVDVQSTAAQKTLSYDLREALPTNKGIASLAALTHGVSLGVIGLYNALNASLILSQVTTCGSQWGTPTEIFAGRFFTFGVQANF